MLMSGCLELRHFLRSSGLALAGGRIGAVARRELLTRPDDHFSALDGIRAMAALLLVAFHSYVCVAHAAGEPAINTQVGHIQWLFDRSWIGVDIFFALSGFLIGRILFLQLLLEGRIRFKWFYVRRAFRIFPAYYTVLTLSLLAFAHVQMFQFIYRGATWIELLQRSPANYLYLSNYLHGGTVPNALALSWSLCIEEHFYLLIPGMLALVFKTLGGRIRLGVLMALLTVPMFARYLAYARDSSICVLNDLYWHSHTHADGLLLGVAVAYCFVFERERMARAVVRLGSVTWLVALACFMSVFWWGGVFAHGFFPVVLQFLVLAIGSTLLVINGLFLDNVITRFCAHPAWCPVARVSYGLYLVHMFAILALLEVWPSSAATLLNSGAQLALFAICAAGLAVAASTLLFLTVERPMLERGVRLSRRYTTAPELSGPIRGA